MKTLKEFLDNPIYLDIIEELGPDNFNKELQSIEIQELRKSIESKTMLIRRV